MKTKVLFLFLIIAHLSYSQINPVNNLTWEQWYEEMHNEFTLSWEEPSVPHDELLGYNVYRENELYRFQTETVLFYTFGFGSNCDEDFIDYEDGNPFDIYVTAVYENGIESEAQMVSTEGAAISTVEVDEKSQRIYPNPTSGILNITIENVAEVIVYNSSGMNVATLAPQEKIDISFLPNGVYFISLKNANGILNQKILLKK